MHPVLLILPHDLLHLAALGLLSLMLPLLFGLQLVLEFEQFLLLGLLLSNLELLSLLLIGFYLAHPHHLVVHQLPLVLLLLLLIPL